MAMKLEVVSRCVSQRTFNTCNLSAPIS